MMVIETLTALINIAVEVTNYYESFQVLPFFFSIWVFFHEHSWITGLQGKGEGIPLTPHYHFHMLHRHLDISWAITGESSPFHIASSQTRTRNLWLPSASYLSLSYKPSNLLMLCYQFFIETIFFVEKRPSWRTFTQTKLIINFLQSNSSMISPVPCLTSDITFSIYVFVTNTLKCPFPELSFQKNLK